MNDPTPGDLTRARILAEALPLFAEHGYAGASVRAIAGAAGVNVATLAYHFGDKEGLYTAVIDRLYGELSTIDVADALASEDPLRAVVAKALAFTRAHADETRLMQRYFLDRGRQHEVFAERWLEPLMGRADPLFEQLRPDWTPRERRLLAFSVSHLISRFALDDPQALGAQLDTHDPDATLIDWIASLVRARLLAP